MQSSNMLSINTCSYVEGLDIEFHNVYQFYVIINVNAYGAYSLQNSKLAFVV